MGSKSDGVDRVVYSLEKFAKLAADCNPNIIEVLHAADEDVLFCDEFGEKLREHRDEFISKKAKFTFSGYANAQLKRIKSHRHWLLDPPKTPPTRKEFGLSETHKMSGSELGAMTAMFPSELSMVEAGLHANIIRTFSAEHAYKQAMTHYEQYNNWVKTRNPARAALEAKYGYDTKHGMHLMRLETMGVEILETHKVNVKRTHDREFLLGVRNGELGYDELIEKAEALEARAEELYQSSTLRKEPNRAKLDGLIVNMTTEYLRRYG
jgi:hypothetical protein